MNRRRFLTVLMSAAVGPAMPARPALAPGLPMVITAASLGLPADSAGTLAQAIATQVAEATGVPAASIGLTFQQGAGRCRLLLEVDLAAAASGCPVPSSLACGSLPPGVPA